MHVACILVTVISSAKATKAQSQSHSLLKRLSTPKYSARSGFYDSYFYNYDDEQYETDYMYEMAADNLQRALEDFTAAQEEYIIAHSGYEMVPKYSRNSRSRKDAQIPYPARKEYFDDYYYAMGDPITISDVNGQDPKTFNFNDQIEGGSWRETCQAACGHCKKKIRGAREREKRPKANLERKKQKMQEMKAKLDDAEADLAQAKADHHNLDLTHDFVAAKNKKLGRTEDTAAKKAKDKAKKAKAKEITAKAKAKADAEAELSVAKRAAVQAYEEWSEVNKQIQHWITNLGMFLGRCASDGQCSMEGIKL